MFFLITNRKLACNIDFYKIIEEAVRAGIYAIILREKDLSYEELLPMALKIKEIIGTSKVKLIINNNLPVANAVNSDGYHTSFSNFINGQVIFKGSLGVSVHSLKEAIEVEKRGGDYVLVGHIFETDCKKGATPKGIELIKTIKNHITIPIISIGGILPSNTTLVMEAGSQGIAVMSTLMKSNSPYLLTKEYVMKMEI